MRLYRHIGLQRFPSKINVTYANADRFSKRFHNKFLTKLSLYLLPQFSPQIHYVATQIF